MEIDKNSLVPIYEQVMDYIKKKIEKGEWKKEDKISTEKDLMELFDVSRGTIKKAISLLVEEKVLTQKQGKGTFVIDENISFPLAEGLISFSESMKSQGIDFETELINLEKKKADDNINIQLAPNIDTADYAHESLFNIVERYSEHKVAYSETSFAAVPSTKTISELLHIEENSPLLYQEQLVHLEDDSIIELGRVWLKSNKFYVGSILQRL